MTGHLVAEGLGWSPRGGARILQDVSFTVARAEVLAICGANGAGKSTLLRMLYRYLRPDAGRVTLGAMTFGRSAPALQPAGWLPCCRNNPQTLP